MKDLFVVILILIANNAPAQTKTGTLLWKYQTEGIIVTTAAIDGNYIYYGSSDGNFYCNALSDGRLLWKYDVGEPVRSSPTVAEGKVFFGCDNGNIYALDALKGRFQWKFATKGEREYDMWDYYRSSPAVVNGRLFIGSGDGNIYAINAANGQKLWNYKTGGVVHADPIISEDTLYVGSFDGNFYALNSISGKLIWKFKTIGDRFFAKGEIQKAALVTQDAVYFGSRDFNLYTLNKSTGTGMWNMKEYGSWIISTPMEKNGKLFFGTSDSHAFYSLNNFYGEISWKTALPMRAYATPAFFDTLIMAGCFNGYLYGFGEKTGKLEWSFQTDGSRKNYGSVYDSSGHFRKDFILYGDDKIAKDAEQKILNLGAIISSPVIKDGIVYFGSTDGNLYAVRIKE